ncbi:MAG: hypothetical protein IJL92_06545 [Thermoguttaceae bacterium]|nr:hypothetical protein [Thermoguttaceae bacterium]
MFDALVLFGLLSFPQIWLAVPLALAFSFCYAASRAEEPKKIVAKALRVAFWLFFFLILVGAILYIAV